MQRRQAYKYELRPTGEQVRLMRRFAGSCRFLFNNAASKRNPLKRPGGGSMPHLSAVGIYDIHAGEDVKFPSINGRVYRVRWQTLPA